MKLRFSNILTAALLLGGCAMESEVAPPTVPMIAFSVSADKEGNSYHVPTRGVPVLEDVIPEGGAIGVHTFLLPASGTNNDVLATAADARLFNDLPSNTTVRRSGATYNYGTPVPWPEEKNDYLKFFAYYPHSSTASGISGVSWLEVGQLDGMALDYRTELDPTKHVDVMYAMSDNLYHTPTVPLKMNHALTRLTVEARLEDAFFDTRPVTVSRVSVKNIRTEGELRVLPKSTTEPNEVNAQWMSLQTPDTIQTTSPETGLSGSALTRTGFTSLLTASGPYRGDMMVIPQALTNVELEIELTIADPVTGTYTELRTVPLAGTQAWGMGKYLNYRFLITRSEVMFDGIEVLPWNTQAVGAHPDDDYKLWADGPARIWYGIEGAQQAIKPTFSTTHPDGIDIAGPFVWGTDEPADWLTWDDGASGGGGIDNYEFIDGDNNVTLYLTALSGVAGGRKAYFRITAGNLRYDFPIIQVPGPWIDFVVDASYPQDGEMHSLEVKTEAEWTVAPAYADSNVGDDKVVTDLYTEQGSGDGGVWFRTAVRKTFKSEKALFTFTDKEGICPPATVEVPITPHYWGGGADILYLDDENRLQIGRWGEEIIHTDQLVVAFFGSVVAFTNTVEGRRLYDLQMNPYLFPFNPTNGLPYSNYFAAGAWTGSVETSPIASSPEYHHYENIKKGLGDLCQLVGLTGAEIRATATEAEFNALLDARPEEYKGWRMPMNEENHMFVANLPTHLYLDERHPGDGYYDWTPNGLSAASPGVATFPKNPGSALPAGGKVDAYSTQDIGIRGTYVSTTLHGSNSNYALTFNAGGLYSGVMSPVGTSYNFRCVKPELTH